MKNTTMTNSSGRLYGAAGALVLACIAGFPGEGRAVNLSNVPMETLIQSPPANIMFVLDNSGSMDWEFSTPGTQGLFNNRYAYLYNATDNTHYNWHYYYLLQGANKKLWKTQWNGYNRLYYNPAIIYKPWPNRNSITKSGLKSVRSNSENPYPVFDLTSAYTSVWNSPSTISITYMHYYTWYDQDGDGGIDNQEIYLVNFLWNSGNILRRYYQVGNNNDWLENNELTEVTGNAIPEAIKARKTLEDGSTEWMTAEEEALNFGNWFAYHRKRSMTAKYAISAALQDLSGVNVGYYTINDNGEGARMTVKPLRVLKDDGTVDDQSATLFSTLYGVKSIGGTPLRWASENVGRYFDMASGAGLPGSPYCSEAEGGACQQAFSILMTDGYYNGGAPSIGNQDLGMGAPYQDNYSNTLADIAMEYYKKDLATALPNNVPTSAVDSRDEQHLVTYSVAFGVEGSIALDDLDGNGITDPAGCNYEDDPYFQKSCTPRPTWPNPQDGDPQKIDDLFHASVNGRGEFFNASDPEELVDSLVKITQDISDRKGSGSSVAVNGEMLVSGSAVFQATYEAGKWTGNIRSYEIDTASGEVKDGAGQELWDAAGLLEAKEWSSRKIISSKDGRTGVEFTFGNLSPLQAQILGPTSDLVNYIKGEENGNYRNREGKKLGDIVHSSPTVTGNITIDAAGNSTGGTVFAGANDGMLHAFDAQTGQERFAYVPSLVFGHLSALAEPNYQHRFYVDGDLYARDVVFDAGNRSADKRDNDRDGETDEPDENYSDGVDNDGDGTTDEVSEKLTINLLAGGLGRGGKGYFMLDITYADDVDSATGIDNITKMLLWEYPRPYFDGINNDGDSTIDEADETFADSEYSYAPANTDTIDNNWDGIADENGEQAVFLQANTGGDPLRRAYIDDDLGYSYSTPFIVRGYTDKPYRKADGSNNTGMPWYVIFGNGYNSVNGHAVLYILDAFTGEIVRKIDTGVGGMTNGTWVDNGLSTPSIIDIDNDDRADFVYAGDLLGNLWKFDLRDRDSAKWGIANNTRDDKTGVPMPMFSAPGQSITTKPDVLHHCTAENGYLVTFGTGRYLGENDRSTTETQTVFAIWDYNDEDHPTNYPGVWTRSSNTVKNSSGTEKKLQEQVIINEQYINHEYYRVTSRYTPDWFASGANGHVGWFFDLPGVHKEGSGGGVTSAYTSSAAERVIKNLMIRDGRLVFVSFVPDDSPCSGGGLSVFHEIDVCTGGRLEEPGFDSNGDGKVNSDDTVPVGTDNYVVSGKGGNGMLDIGAIIQKDKDTELKITSDSEGNIDVISEKAETVGAYYWQEVSN